MRDLANQTEPETEEDQDDRLLQDPHEFHASSRRSDRELDRLLNLLDSLDGRKA